MAFIQISKANLFFNLDTISKRVGNKDKIAVVLKDNAYGHGIELISSLCVEYGITKAVVRDTLEAVLIQDKFDEILILSELDNFIKKPNFIYTINSTHILKKLTNINIALKVDTGMHRNGIAVNELQESIEYIQNSNLTLHSIMTHFRSADILSTEQFWQKKQWDYIKTIAPKNIKFHSQNSSSIFRDNTFDDFVRVGLGIYGYVELNKTIISPKLKPILSLWANKISTRYLNSNSRLGYGGATTIDRSIMVSSYDIGYGDGLPRLTPKDNYKLPNNLQIQGNVSMDSIMLICDDDNICIFNDASKLSNIKNTIVYDILVKLSTKLQRVQVA